MAYATTIDAPSVIPFVVGSIILLLRSLTVAAHELINTSCCVNELALTCIEWVRGARDFDFYHWVSFAFEFYCIVCLCCRLREEHIAVGHVLKHDGAIVFWMNTFFHFEFKILMFKNKIHAFGLQVPCKPNAESSLFAEVKPGLGPNLAAKVRRFFESRKLFSIFFVFRRLLVAFQLKVLIIFHRFPCPTPRKAVFYKQTIAEVLFVYLIGELTVAIAVFFGIGGLDEHCRASFLVIGVIERVDVNSKSHGVFGEL